MKIFFLEQNDCPVELKHLFQRDDLTCALSFLQHFLFEIHRKDLELQRHYVTVVDLYRIITSIKDRLAERINSKFFGAACRYRLARLPIDVQKDLKSSFIKFLTSIITYIDSYFIKNIDFYRTISYFRQGIENLTWNQIVQCLDFIKIKGLDEDHLFSEFSNLKSVFKTVLDQPISVFDQVQGFIQKQNATTMMIIRQWTRSLDLINYGCTCFHSVIHQISRSTCVFCIQYHVVMLMLNQFFHK